MPTENKNADPEFDLSTSAGGRGYIANLFKTQLKRHDFTTYINERLAADFAAYATAVPKSSVALPQPYGFV